MPEGIRKILLIRLDHMGDAILATPMLEALAQKYPEAEITCIVSSRSYPVFEHDSRIARKVIFDLPQASRPQKREMASWVRQERFDLVISLTEKFWAAMWSLYSGSQIRIGFDAGLYMPLHMLWRRPSFTHHIRTENNPFVLSPFHEVERYMQLIHPLGITDPAGPLTVRTDPSAPSWAAERWAALNLPTDAIPIGFHFSAVWGGEGWSQGVQSQIIRELLARDERVVVIGTAGPGEAELLAQLADELPGDRFHLFQAMTFSQWVELARRLRVYLSVDTGAVHIAAAAGVPTLAVFPDKCFAHKSTRWHPWGVPYRVLQRPLPQQPEAQEFPRKIIETAWELLERF